jgi:hypothetical protein
VREIVLIGEGALAVGGGAVGVVFLLKHGAAADRLIEQRQNWIIEELADEARSRHARLKIAPPYGAWLRKYRWNLCSDR